MKKSKLSNDVQLKDLPPIDRLRMAMDSEVYDFTRMLEGKILTIVDASFTDRDQREAVKSLVRQTIWSQGFDCSGIAWQFAKRWSGQPIASSEGMDYVNSHDRLPSKDHFSD